MATIAQKTPFVGSTGQCLILASKEKLLYPFNFGDYSEVRFGMYYSVVTGSDDTAVSLSTLAVPASSSNTQKTFFGFCNYLTGTNLPGQVSGYDYVGAHNFGATNDFGIERVNATNSRLRGGMTDAENYAMGFTDYTGAKITLLDGGNVQTNFWMPTSSDNATNFAGMMGMQIAFSGSNLVAVRPFSNNTTFTSNVSTSALRSDIANLGTIRPNPVTGYFTTGNVNSSNVLMKPNALLIYFPLLNGRIRINNLVVERYA